MYTTDCEWWIKCDGFVWRWQTTNYNFPILEAGDKYIKDYHNDAFNVIDTELKAMDDKIIHSSAFISLSTSI